MIKNQFSNDIAISYATAPQAQQRYKISRKTLMKYAEKYDAIVRFGRSVRINIEKFDIGIEREKENKNE